MSKLRATMLTALLVAAAMAAGAQRQSPLVLGQTIPLPGLKDGDFDHFAVDLPGQRLFSAAEDNSKVLVFDLRTNKLLHTLSDLKGPHSMVYRGDVKKLFVVDGDLGVVRMYDGDSYKPAGDIKLRLGADSSVYDPATKYLYVVTGGQDAHLPYSFLSVVDTTNGKQLADIKLDSDDVETLAIENSGPRLFVLIRGTNKIEVFDRQKRILVATWPLAASANKPTAMAFDEAEHRLFVGTRAPGKIVVVNSVSGKVVTSLSAASMVDDISYDRGRKRIYFAGTDFLDVFQERDPDHYDLIGHLPTGFRAKTAILVPELNRYYLGVPHHGSKEAEVRAYEVQP